MKLQEAKDKRVRINDNGKWIYGRITGEDAENDRWIVTWQDKLVTTILKFSNLVEIKIEKEYKLLWDVVLGVCEKK